MDEEQRSDDLATAEALIQQLSDVVDPVEQREVLDAIDECCERLTDASRTQDALRLLDSLLSWQLGDGNDHGREIRPNDVAFTMLRRAGRLRDLDRHPEAIAQCDELVARYDEDAESAAAELQRLLRTRATGKAPAF